MLSFLGGTSSSTNIRCRSHTTFSLVMNQLPPEILTKILSYLSHQDLLTSVNKVCSYWRSTTFSSVLWMDIDVSDCEDWELELYLKDMCHVSDFVQTLEIDCEQLKTVFERASPNGDTFSNLRKLTLVGHLLNDEINFCKLIVKHFPKLMSIRIHFSDSNDPNCLSVLSILKLEEFNIWTSISMDSALLNFINFQSNITSLAICDENLKSETFSQILNHLDNLKSLDISLTDNLDSSTFDGLTSLSKLTEIHFHGTSIDNKGLQRITKRAMNLKSVHMLFSENLTDVGIGHIANNCTNLECLTISESQNICLSSQTLEMLGKRCSKIKRICLDGATDLNDPGIISLVNNCEQLQWIDIQSNNISNVALIAISDVCATLSHLTIDGKNIYVSGIERILTQSKQLKHLSIGYCLDVDKIDLRKFIKGDGKKVSGSLRFSWVNIFNINGHSFSSHTVIEEIATFCPYLRTLSLPYFDPTIANVTTAKDCNFIHETAFRECQYLEYLSLGLCSMKRSDNGFYM